MNYRLAALFVLACCNLFAQHTPGNNPFSPENAGVSYIQGIAHVGFRVADLDKTRAYYARNLGIPEAYDQKDGSGKTALIVLKVASDQFLEFSQGAPVGFTHVAFLTDKLDALHQAVLGLNPSQIRTGRDRTRSFSIQDPDRHRIEFVEYGPDSLQAQTRGKFVSRVGGLRCVGLPVADRQIAASFFDFKIGSLGLNRYVQLLPANAPVHILLLVGDEGMPTLEPEPDGLRIELTSQ